MTPFDWAKYRLENPPEEMTAEQHRKANRFHFGKDWETTRPDLLGQVLRLEQSELRKREDATTTALAKIIQFTNAKDRQNDNEQG